MNHFTILSTRIAFPRSEKLLFDSTMPDPFIELDWPLLFRFESWKIEEPEKPGFLMFQALRVRSLIIHQPSHSH